MRDDNKPVLTSEDIREILQALESSSFNSLELEIGDIRLRLRRGACGETAAAPSLDAREPPAPAARHAAGNGVLAAATEPPPGTVEIRAPTLGIFYRAPRPGAAPFVDVGTVVTPQTTVGIIEVMKLMNGVLAGVEGEIREICAEDGVAVQYDQVLMRVGRP
jgi:acetyl-CoA carboxylase biotin carboxyl carrier protein